MPHVEDKNQQRALPVAAARAIAQVGEGLAHPLRAQILNALEGDVSSPKQLASRFPASLGTVAYHIRVLNKCRLIHQVERRPRRGALEHFYALTPAGQAVVKLLPGLAALPLGRPHHQVT